MNRFDFICGISGIARSGKDTLFTILQKILLEHKITLIRIALADSLKLEINDFCIKNYGISAFDKDAKKKEIVRGIMLAHGKAKRTLSNGTYWTSLVEPQIAECKELDELVCLTDIRYCDPQYPDDELNWLKDKNNGILIHLERTLPNGQLLKSNIEDEIKFDPIMKSKADYHLKWATSSDTNTLFDTVRIQLSSFINRILENSSLK